ncbi:hypothetical protein GCM10009678_07390 [Actinomadura kijaniata]|uniref:Uncharacterized protein n=1 Tax=Actinomadura namibiensis TaxID=182080 RepID=A0A7W3QK99_ACTNM|nr:hypothetical protein [Actinomadura namibiensis]MBA8950294.1 hypothetical protein [Actinomadura namibiensis]
MPPVRDREARRRRRRAVLEAPAPGGVPEGARPPLRVLAGTVLDASPHLLVLRTAAGETRVPMTEATRIWRGGSGGLAALRPGRRAVVRAGGDGPAADRVWVDIGRVTGTVLTRGRDTVEVDMGPHRGRAHVVIPPRVLGRVLVRHPRLEPGYLIDVVCVTSPDGPVAVTPGTSQPGYRADRPAAADPYQAPPDPVRGTATWFGGVGASRDVFGLAYPAVDGEGHAGGCVDAPAGCAVLPWLSLGSEVVVHNECGERAAVVPVVECGCVAARYCDRCVECGTSPRGRIVELTAVAFAGLGGDLAAGCFNVAVHHGVRNEEGSPW